MILDNVPRLNFSGKGIIFEERLIRDSPNSARKNYNKEYYQVDGPIFQDAICHLQTSIV